MYKFSKYVEFVEHNNLCFVFHRLKGNAIILPIKIKNKILNYLENKNEIDFNIKKYFNKMVEKKIIIKKNEIEKRNFNEYNNKNFLITKGITIQITYDCNFKCKYCLINSLKISKNNLKNDINIYKSFIKQYIKHVKDNNLENIDISFNGGETLLEWNLIKKIVSFIEKERDNYKVSYRINTNAFLVNDEIAKFLKEKRFKIFTSLDGLKNGNDSVRVLNDNIGTFEKIVDKIMLLKQY